ncbi:hypothetical protein DFH06DRAFT_1309581 [Mycena polygramma]|nr:hypothetical protein DFH06DRAFT_1309581 [Mycena polygramma]
MSNLTAQGIDPEPPLLIPIYPFTTTHVADASLRSCDGADFYIVRAILSLLSPVFATMFRLPQPDATPAIPVVDMEENAVTLDKALRFIYPGTEPIVDSFEDLRTIIELVIDKYDMQCEIPKAKRYLQGYCSSHCVAVYAVAVKFGWRDVAVVAAKESLKQPLRSLNTEETPWLNGLTAVAYHRLLHYHYLCGQVARSKATDLTWIAPLFVACNTCTPSPTSPIIMFSTRLFHRVPAWFDEYLSALRNILVETPGTNIREGLVFHVALGKARCTKCNAFSCFREFGTSELPAHVEAEISKIQLKF